MSKPLISSSGLLSSSTKNLLTMSDQRTTQAPLYALPYAWALRLRRNKFLLIKVLLCLALVSYFIILFKSKYDDLQQVGPPKPIGIPKTHQQQQEQQQQQQQQLQLQQPLQHDKRISQANSMMATTNDQQKQQKNSVAVDGLHQTATPAKGRLMTNGNNDHDGDIIILQHPKVATQASNRLALIKKRLNEKLKFLMPTREGWGENGDGVTLTDEVEKQAAARRFSEGAFNVYVSDRISVNRSLKAVAASECQQVKYNLEELPNVSVIIIFTNEIFSTLIRTIWSVINRSPKRLLKEIILVDDFSDSNHLKQTLQDYIDVNWPNNLVRLYHLPERQGLIKARLKGADEASGDVLLFLDSHCEVSPIWLEPLVQRIKDNRKVFICPVIDIISDKTLEYNPVDPYYFQLGGFDWTGHFTWINRNQKDVGAHPTRPVKSPTMAGGLFAVDRKYFYQVGAYDRDMLIWGGENLELSFRVWQCGGRIEIHPCSHVGHIFRDYHPYSFQGIDSHGINTVRTVRVWMEDYARYFFMSRPDLRQLDVGDLSERYKLKKQLDCGSFKQYLEQVYEQRKFIYDKNVQAYGFVQNPVTNLCLDTLNRKESGDGPADKAGLYECDDKLLDNNLDKIDVITNQLFSLTLNGELRRESVCLVKGEHRDDLFVYMDHCEDEPEYLSEKKKKRLKINNKVLRQKWRHKYIDQQRIKSRGGNNDIIKEYSNGALIINQASDECLSTTRAHSESDLRLAPCDHTDLRQVWRFSRYNTTSNSNDDDNNNSMLAGRVVNEEAQLDQDNE